MGKIAREDSSFPGHQKEESAGYKAAMEQYVDHWKRVHGEAPVFVDTDHKALKQLLKSVGLEKTKRAIDNAFASDFWRDKATIQGIRSNPNRFLVLKPAGKPGDAKVEREWIDIDTGIHYQQIGGKKYSVDKNGKRVRQV